MSGLAGLDTVAVGRFLIAGVGFTDVSDASVGPVVAAQLALRSWPAGVTVSDYGCTAIEAIQRLRDGAYDRACFFGSESRGDAPGTVRRYRPSPKSHDSATVRECLDEARESMISLRTTIVVAGHFGVLPKDTIVFEVEPENMDYGRAFSPAVEEAVRELNRLIDRAVQGSPVLGRDPDGGPVVKSVK